MLALTLICFIDSSNPMMAALQGRTTSIPKNQTLLMRKKMAVIQMVKEILKMKMKGKRKRRTMMRTRRKTTRKKTTMTTTILTMKSRNEERRKRETPSISIQSIMLKSSSICSKSKRKKILCMNLKRYFFLFWNENYLH